jgi:hypothetical protein
MPNSAETAHHRNPPTIERAEVDKLEQLIGQLESIHSELSALSKKSPVDGVNKFKLKFVNEVVREANGFLGESYRPSAEFQEFNSDDVPSNSDVTFVIALYLQAVERFRADHLIQEHGLWYFNTVKADRVRTGAPAKLVR